MAQGRADAAHVTWDIAQFIRFAEYDGLLCLSCCDSTSARNAACTEWMPGLNMALTAADNSIGGHLLRMQLIKRSGLKVKAISDLPWRNREPHAADPREQARAWVVGRSAPQWYGYARPPGVYGMVCCRYRLKKFAALALYSSALAGSMAAMSTLSAGPFSPVSKL